MKNTWEHRIAEVMPDIFDEMSGDSRRKVELVLEVFRHDVAPDHIGANVGPTPITIFLFRTIKRCVISKKLGFWDHLLGFRTLQEKLNHITIELNRLGKREVRRLNRTSLNVL